ncbi:hypothetical protein AB4114_22640 [Paenibacillus sp. 2RAB27]|uniref:hypothetical protein n=1 Tax=Paenibacillus sp. 2RAB27 TaxID=3232991 RepID=UPI003F9486B5
MFVILVAFFAWVGGCVGFKPAKPQEGPRVSDLTGFSPSILAQYHEYDGLNVFPTVNFQLLVRFFKIPLNYLQVLQLFWKKHQIP